MNLATKIDSNLTKGDIRTIRAMITYMFTEDTDCDDKFLNKLFNLDEKFTKLASKFELE